MPRGEPRERRPLTPEERQVVEDNLRLVWKVVRHLWDKPGCRETFQDEQEAFQAGVIGLSRAVQLYDPEKARLSTYAWYAIEHAILSQWRSIAHQIHLPHNITRSLARVARGLPVVRGGHRRANLDKGRKSQVVGRLPVDRHGKDRLPAPTPRDPHAHDDLYAALDRIRPEERELLVQLYGIGSGEGRTLEDVGRERGRTKQRIRQLKERALAALRKEMQQAA